MASKKVKCTNCGREMSGINAAKNDGWIVNEDGTLFCCCVCISEYNRSKKTKKKKA
jgi:hypothetical protein